MDNKLPKNITEKLEIRNLNQVYDEDLKNRKFAFLGLGKLILSYNIKVEKVDEFASRLAGCDNPYALGRSSLKSSHITIPVPKESTNYYLGELIADEELYINHKENSHSRDLAPIIFLKEI